MSPRRVRSCAATGAGGYPGKPRSFDRATSMARHMRSPNAACLLRFAPEWDGSKADQFTSASLSEEAFTDGLRNAHSPRLESLAIGDTVAHVGSRDGDVERSLRVE